MTHVVTVWWRRGADYQIDEFEAAHVRSTPFAGGAQIELLDERWRVFGVEQFPAVDRVSVRRTDG